VHQVRRFNAKGVHARTQRPLQRASKGVPWPKLSQRCAPASAVCQPPPPSLGRFSFASSLPPGPTVPVSHTSYTGKILARCCGPPVRRPVARGLFDCGANSVAGSRLTRYSSGQTKENRAPPCVKVPGSSRVPGALHYHWTVIATKPISQYVPVQTRGILHGTEEKTRPRGGKSIGITDQPQYPRL
jgi:hypothetical protein